MPGGYGPARPQQLGHGDPGRGGVPEDGAHPPQDLGQRAARPDLAQIGGGQQPRLRIGDGQPQPLALRRHLGLLVGEPQPVGAAQPQHERVDRTLVAHRKRVAQIDEYGVGEGRHRGPAEPQHDLVQVYAPGDPAGRRADEAQPVPFAADDRRLAVGLLRGARSRAGRGGGGRDGGGGSGARYGLLLPGPGAFLRPGRERLPAFVGGGMLRHAWDSVRPGRLYEAITSWGATVPRRVR
ncbi:hypothetical protein GCM10020227_47490 [Streptomyces flavovirens]